MREWTLVRRMRLGSAAAIALLGMVLGNVATAQTIHEPHTMLRIVESEPTVVESSPTVAAYDARGTCLTIRSASAKSTQEVVPSDAGGNFPASLAEMMYRDDASARLRLEVATSPNLSSRTTSQTSGRTELRLNPLPDSSRIVARPVAGGVAFNTLRSEETLPSAEVSVGWPSSSLSFGQRSTYATNTTPRPNVLRMGDGPATPDRIQIVAYQKEPQTQPFEPADTSRAGEPRQRTFSAAPLSRLTEQLGPFEVTDQLDVLNIVQRCGKVLRTTRKVERTEVADPNVCTVVQFTPGELSIVAKQAGQTRVTFWFEGLQAQPISYVIHVVPNPLSR